MLRLGEGDRWSEPYRAESRYEVNHWDQRGRLIFARADHKGNCERGNKVCMFVKEC